MLSRSLLKTDLTASNTKELFIIELPAQTNLTAETTWSLWDVYYLEAASYWRKNTVS